MNFFELLNKSKLALSKESELELNYFLSKENIDEVIYEDKKIKQKFKGIFLQSSLFFFRILSNLSFFEKKISTKPVYAVLGTYNQFISIKSTLEALEAKGDKFLLSINKNVFHKNYYSKYSKPVKFNIKVALCGLVLFFSHVLPLYLELKRKNKEYEITMKFNLFCEAYILVPFFIDMLKKVQPKIIIVSNDHHVINRSLRLSAEIMEVKTLYLQHASVNELFPPLEFNYALLDGNIAHKYYIQCYQIQPRTNLRVEKNIANCQVMLTGQKKLVVKINEEKKLKGLHIGIAVNPLDDFDYLKKLLDHLSPMKVKCVVRTHQGQSLFFLKLFKAYIRDKNWISWSDSREHLISNYFMQVNLLIANNSSIHLEAALAGLPTFYYQMHSEVLYPDDYGYIKNGISKKLETNFSFELLKNFVNSKNNDSQRLKSIKDYSETYGTAWQNQEGKLSALIINRILNDKPLDDLFKIEKSKIYKSVNFLK
jgi:hypothetical protein